MHKLALAVALLLTNAQAAAVALGAPEGIVWMGRPFDVAIQTQIQPGMGLADLCLQPQLSFGEVPIPPASISVTLERVQDGGRALLRLRSNMAVNAPTVTLTLSAGCQGVFRRSYTFLADLEPQVFAPATVPVTQQPALETTGVVAVAPVLTPALVSVPLPPQSVEVDRTVSAMATGAVALVPETPVRIDAPRPRPVEVTRMRSKSAPLALVAPSPAAAAPSPIVSAPAAAGNLPAPAGGARLQLEPVPLSAPNHAPLSSAMPATAEAAQGSSPEQAPPGALPDQRSTLEQELAGLRAEQERLRLELESKQAQLLQAQQHAGANPVPPVWWMGAGILALLLLAALWYGLRTGRIVFGRARAKREPWWHTTQAETAAPAPAVHQPTRGSKPAASTVSAVNRSAPLASSTASAAQMGVAPIASEPTPNPELVALSVDGLEVSEGRLSMFGEVPITPLDAGRLLEVWQQAEFFESIAQPVQAMQVLAAYVNACPRVSEAPYLRWLKLEELGARRVGPGPAAQCYENHFQCAVPPREARLHAAGLEDDAVLMRSVQAQWPLASVRAVLEGALASQPGSAQGGGLSVRTLAVFDDLIFLLALLDTLDSSPSDWIDIDALTPPAGSKAPAPAAAPASSPGAGRDPMWIDFDLSHLDALSARPATPTSEAAPKRPHAG